MKRLAPLIVLVLVLGILALHGYQRAAAEQERFENEASRVRSLQEEVAMLRNRIASPNVMRGIAIGSDVIAKVETQAVQPVSGVDRCDEQSVREFMQEKQDLAELKAHQELLAIFRSAEGRKRARDAAIDELRPRFSDYFEEQGIPAPIASQVLEALAEQRINARMNSKTPGQAEYEGEMKKLQNETDSALAGFLGDKYLQYQIYLASLPEREIVSYGINNTLRNIDAPLQPAQRARMLDVLVNDKNTQGKLEFGIEAEKRRLAKFREILTPVQYKELEKEILFKARHSSAEVH